MYIDTITLRFESKEELEFYKKNLSFLDIYDESKYYQGENEEDKDLWIEFIIEDSCCADLGKELDQLYALYNFSEQDAIDVANQDINCGVATAIRYLEYEHEFDCSYYWDIINKLDPNKLDESLLENRIERLPDDTFPECTNLCIRDRLYRLLGIYDEMQEAYEKIENSNEQE